MEKTLPKGWEMVRLGEVAKELKSGFAFGKSDKNSNGVPHIRPMNISLHGQLVWEETKYISKEFLKNNEEYTLKKGDVLFNNTNSKELVGKTCYVKEDIYGGYSNHLTRIRIDDSKVDAEFLSILLQILSILLYNQLKNVDLQKSTIRAYTC
jgi:type I restriction enzyme S subunit